MNIPLISLQKHDDARGALVAIEENKNIPFPVKRVYYLYNTQPEIRRGFHAHKKLKQLAIVVKGSCRFLLDDGSENVDVLLDDPAQGLLIDPMVWHEMYDFSADCVLLVLADDLYYETDYIRSHEEFTRLAQCKPSIRLVDYDQEFLDKSWHWLNDLEIKKLTMTPDFSKEDQEKFYASLPTRENYRIFGLMHMNKKIGACGLKNITLSEAELWCYIGEKDLWGKGLGKEVIAAIEKIAIELKLRKLTLKVLNDNERAIRLYENCGFNTVERLENYLTMGKALP